MVDETKAKENDYSTIKLTKSFMTLVDWILHNSDLNFESRSDVVRTAVRELYNREKAKKGPKLTQF